MDEPHPIDVGLVVGFPPEEEEGAVGGKVSRRGSSVGKGVSRFNVGDVVGSPGMESMGGSVGVGSSVSTNPRVGSNVSRISTGGSVGMLLGAVELLGPAQGFDEGVSSVSSVGNGVVGGQGSRGSSVGNGVIGNGLVRVGAKVSTVGVSTDRVGVDVEVGLAVGHADPPHPSIPSVGCIYHEY